jgi:cytochrome P450
LTFRAVVIDTEQVTDRPSITYDHHSPEHAAGAAALYAELRARCPIAWTERYGGFWVASAFEPCVRVAKDPERFRSDHDVDGTREGYQGITIPSLPNQRFIPSEADPPEFLEYRHLLQPWFSPGKVARWEGFVRDDVTARLDERVGSGAIDLVLDLANPVPAVVTLAFVGLPAADWERFADPIHASAYTPPGTPEKAAAIAGIGELAAVLRDVVRDRRATPRDDLATAVATAEIGGVLIEIDRAVDILQLVVAGGVDTTTALLANTFVWLSEHPDVRTRLVEEPERIPIAREEFLRYFTPTQATARTASVNVELGDVMIGAGERVLMSWAAANRDPAVFDSPEEVDIDRAPNPHLTFGAGPHRCLGIHFARMIIRVVLEEVLARIPDYVVDLDGAERYRTIGVINGWIKVPATFTPGGAPRASSS